MTKALPLKNGVIYGKSLAKAFAAICFMFFRSLSPNNPPK
jgi:hypothetical protein